jgi:hypothetical protein
MNNQTAKSLEDLIRIGLEYGYITCTQFEQVVKNGEHPNRIKIHLEDRHIKIHWHE